MFQPPQFHNKNNMHEHHQFMHPHSYYPQSFMFQTNQPNQSRPSVYPYHPNQPFIPMPSNYPYPPIPPMHQMMRNNYPPGNSYAHANFIPNQINAPPV